jgi:hypothetical protein
MRSILGLGLGEMKVELSKMLLLSDKSISFFNGKMLSLHRANMSFSAYLLVMFMVIYCNYSAPSQK